MTQPETARVERGPVTEVPHFALGMAALLERQGFTVAANEMRRLHAELRRLQIDSDALGVHLSERMKDLFKVEAQRDALLEALKAMLRDPTGCAFCDSGRPRKSVLTGELCEHDDRCGFVLARAAIKAVEGENT